MEHTIQISDKARMMSPETSCRITAVRWLCIMFIVIYHGFQTLYFLKTEVSPIASKNINLGNSEDLLCLFTSILIIGSVSMFVFFSSYLQFMRSRTYGCLIVNRIRGLLVPMALWTVIAVLQIWVSSPWMGWNGSFNYIRTCDAQAWFNGLIGNYAQPFSNAKHCPSMFQFWFIRDLFVLNLCSPLIIAALKKIPWVFLCCSGALMISGYAPVIFCSDMLFFYSLGAYCAINNIEFFHLADRFCPWWCLLCCLVVEFLLFKDNVFKAENNWLVLCVSFLMMLKLSKWIANWKKGFQLAEKLDGQAFFLFCAHGNHLAKIIAFVLVCVLPVHLRFWAVSSMFILIVLNILICTLAGILLRQFCPSVFALLTGGRGCKRRQ